MNYVAALIGRILIAVLFLWSGIMKVTDPTMTAQMMSGVGLPGNLALAVGIFEIVAALCLIVGFMTRLASLLLAGYTALTILFFHHDFTTMEGMGAVMQHLALIGGLLCLFAHSQMRWSYDSMRLTRRAEIAERDSVAKVHEAEVRAATAEARAEGMRTAPVAPVVTAPARTTKIDRDGDGVDDRDERPRRTARKIDRDGDGIDDRD